MAATYCNRCGCENSSDRGACVRCLNSLQWPAAGNSCGNCGADNAAHASYCFNCGSSIGGAEPADDWSLASAINLVLGGSAEIGPADDEPGDEDYLGGGADPESVPELDFEDSGDDLEVAPPPAPDEVDEPEMFEPAEDMDEEDALEMPPPPPDLDDGDMDSEFAPLTPEDAAPRVEEAALEDLALELAVPEPLDLPDEPVEFAPPVATEAPADEPVADAAADDDDDEALGGWALDLGDDE